MISRFCRQNLSDRLIYTVLLTLLFGNTQLSEPENCFTEKREVLVILLYLLSVARQYMNKEGGNFRNRDIRRKLSILQKLNEMRPAFFILRCMRGCMEATTEIHIQCPRSGDKKILIYKKSLKGRFRMYYIIYITQIYHPN